jgi:hypothetical protein
MKETEALSEQLRPPWAFDEHLLFILDVAAVASTHPKPRHNPNILISKAQS